MKRRRELRLTTPRQIAAIGSPVRVEIAEHLRHAGSGSVKDLARVMGRSPTALHYHINALRRAGIVRVAWRRRSGKVAEAVYTLAADRILIHTRPGRTPSVRAASKTIAAGLRLALREITRALSEPCPSASGPTRNVHARRLRAALSPEGVARVNRALDELERVFVREIKKNTSERPSRARTADTPHRPVALTFVLAPAGISPADPSAPRKPSRAH